MGAPVIAQPITEAEVNEAQKVWGEGIVAIGVRQSNIIMNK